MLVNMETICEKRKRSKRTKLSAKRFKCCHKQVASRSFLKCAAYVRRQIEPKPDYLSHLPDLCLLAILERLPLVDLIRVGRVCRRLHQFQPLIYDKVRSLNLFSYCHYNYSATDVIHNIREKMDLLRFLELQPAQVDFIVGITESLYQQWILPSNQQIRKSIRTKYPLVNCTNIVPKLCRTFGNITKLVLFDCHLYEEEVIQLLTTWRQTLTTLVLVIIRTDFEWERILPTINNLPLLRHLSLYIAGGLIWNVPLPVLGQLNSFYFGYHNYYFGLARTWLYRLFAQLNPNCLQHFGFGFFSARTHSAQFVRRNMGQLLKSKPLIASCLTRLKVPKLSPTFLSFLGTNFPSITWLDIEFDSCRNLTNVAKLKQLGHLTIRSNSRPYSASPIDKLTDRQLIRTVPQVDSVRHLVVLDFAIRNDILRFIFPNARVERIVRGDHNKVDYPKPGDAVNLNRLNWRQIGQDNYRQVFEQARRQLTNWY